MIDDLLKMFELASVWRTSKLKKEDQITALISELEFNRQILEFIDWTHDFDPEELLPVLESLKSVVYQQLVGGGFDFDLLGSLRVETNGKQAFCPVGQKLASIYTRIEVLRVYCRLKGQGQSVTLKALKVKQRGSNLVDDLDRVLKSLRTKRNTKARKAIV